MTWIFMLIFSLFLKSSTCQLQCVKEILDDKDFSINMTRHISVEAGHCISIPFEMTFPKNKVTTPYEKIWFEQDPQTNVDIKVVNNMEYESKNTFEIDGLPRGEYEYGFKLEWGCNQTYIFPKRIRISVSELTRKPTVRVPPMKEGQAATLTCNPARLCSGRAKVYWKWTKADGQYIVHSRPILHRHRTGFFCGVGENPALDEIDRMQKIDGLRSAVAEYMDAMEYRFFFTPTADDHNTNITCVAEYGYSVVETTVTLTVKFSPQILNGSQCLVEGKLQVCVCISRGNPLSPITWPLASLTDYSVTSSSSIQTVTSTITMPAADYHNSTIKCISSNELGQAEIEIPRLQNYTDIYWLDWRQKLDANLPWITAVSFSVNLILLISLIICAYKRCKSTRKKKKKKKFCEEMNTYASLNKADVAQEYGVISLQPRYNE